MRQNRNEATDINNGLPSDSNLSIELELLSWKSVVDVTGDKKVLKKIMKAGEGFDRPNEGSLVKGNIAYNTYKVFQFIKLYNSRIRKVLILNFSQLYTLENLKTEPFSRGRDRMKNLLSSQPWKVLFFFPTATLFLMSINHLL